MRNFQKKQCLETIEVLSEAHGEIVKLIENKRVQGAAELMEQCQQGAIGIGTLVDSTEGEGRRSAAWRSTARFCTSSVRSFWRELP